MKLVPIYAQGLRVVGHAKVDDEDYERLMLWRWNMRDGYAGRSWRRADGTTGGTTMHRQLLGLQLGELFYGDHINRDKLDNQKANLRIVTVEQSAQNRGPRRVSRSRFRGVNFVVPSGKWIARVRLGNKLHNLGTYDSEEEAARVAALFRAEHMPFSAEDVAA